MLEDFHIPLLAGAASLWSEAELAELQVKIRKSVVF